MKTDKIKGSEETCMKKESTAILLRIFIGESDHFKGKPLYMHIVEMLKAEGIAGATVFRGIAGFGKHSRIHTTSILRLSTDMPILIEVSDLEENIDRVRPKLDEVITQGLITEEKVKIVFYDSGKDK
jgi:PII-like signaling protein